MRALLINIITKSLGVSMSGWQLLKTTRNSKKNFYVMEPLPMYVILCSPKPWHPSTPSFGLWCSCEVLYPQETFSDFSLCPSQAFDTGLHFQLFLLCFLLTKMLYDLMLVNQIKLIGILASQYSQRKRKKKNLNKKKKTSISCLRIIIRIAH